MTNCDAGSTPLVSIIIVNFNGKRFLKECLDSIDQYCASFVHETIVVDNASSDGSVEYIDQCFPRVRLVVSKENLGFTGGNNLGAKHAVGKYLLLLNNDTVLVEDMAPLVEYAKQEFVGVVAPRLVYGNMSLQPSVGYEHSPMRIALSWVGFSKFRFIPKVFKRIESRSDFYENSKESVDWVSGACFVTPRMLWNRVAGFDQGFFMYCEDVDYCRRIRDQGYRVAYLSNITVLHYEGGGKSWIGGAAVERTFRSYLYYVEKHYGVFARVAIVLPLSGVMAMRGAIYALMIILAERGDGRKVACEKSLAFLRVAKIVASGWGFGEKRRRF